MNQKTAIDYEMEFAKEAGPMAVADLQNRREEEAKRVRPDVATPDKAVDVKPGTPVVNLTEAMMCWAVWQQGRIKTSPIFPSAEKSSWPSDGPRDWQIEARAIVRVAKYVTRVRGYQQAKMALVRVHLAEWDVENLPRGQKDLYLQFLADLSAQLKARPINYTPCDLPTADVALMTMITRKMEERVAKQRAGDTTATERKRRQRERLRAANA